MGDKALYNSTTITILACIILVLSGLQLSRRRVFMNYPITTKLLENRKYMNTLLFDNCNPDFKIQEFLLLSDYVP